MARTNTVNKAAKDVGNCLVCRKELKKGDAYKWFKPYRSRKRVACTTCHFKNSHTCTSKWVTIYEAMEQLEDVANEFDYRTDISEVEDAVQELTDACEEVESEYREAAEAWGDAGAEMEEKADNVGDWDTDVDFDEKPHELDDDDEPKNDEERDALEVWVCDVQSAVEDMLGNCPGEM